MNTRKVVHTFKVSTGSINDLAFSSDNKLIASAGPNDQATIWELATGKRIQTLQGHSGYATSVCFSPGGKLLVVACVTPGESSRPAEIRFWDWQSGHILGSIAPHADGVTRICYSSDGQYLASASLDTLVKIRGRDSKPRLLSVNGLTGFTSNYCFSPDGERIIAAAQDTTIKVLDASTATELYSLRGHSQRVSQLVCNPVDPYVVSAAGSAVKLWNWRKGELVHDFPTNDELVHGLVFSADGKYLAGALGENKLAVWDVGTGKQRASLTVQHGHPSHLRFAAKDKHIVYFGQRRDVAKATFIGTCAIWDWENGSVRVHWTGELGDIIMEATFSPEGKLLAQVQWGRAFTRNRGEVKVFDLANGQTVIRLKPAAVNDPSRPRFSPDSKKLALVSSFNTIHIYDMSTGEEAFSIQTPGTVLDLTFSSDGKRLATVHKEGLVVIWDAMTGAKLLTLTGETTLDFATICFDPKDRCLAVSGGTTNKSAYLQAWYATSDQDPVFRKQCGGRLTSLQFTPDGKRIVLGVAGLISSPEQIIVLDTQTGKETFLVKDLGGSSAENAADLVFLSVSPIGDFVASATGNLRSYGKELGEVMVWDSSTGDRMLSLKGHRSNVWSVCFSPDGKTLATGSGSFLLFGERPEVKLWDIQTKKCIQTLTGHSKPIAGLAFHPKQPRLASASWDGTVKVWDLKAGRLVLTLMGHSGGVGSIDYAPDGTLIASAGEDGTIKLWNSETGKGITTLKGHRGAVQRVCFSPEGRYLASCSADRTIKLWDMETKKEVSVFRGHVGTILGLAFHPNGRQLASCDLQGLVMIWAIPKQ